MINLISAKVGIIEMVFSMIVYDSLLIHKDIDIAVFLKVTFRSSRKFNYPIYSISLII